MRWVTTLAMVSFHELVEDDKGEVSTLKVTIFAVAAVHVVALVSRNGALCSPSSVRAARFVAFTSFTESACVIVRLRCLGPNRAGPRTSFIASNVRSRRDDHLCRRPTPLPQVFWVYMTLTQKPVRVRDRVDLSKGD